jgi:hypothetical protein
MVWGGNCCGLYSKCMQLLFNMICLHFLQINITEFVDHIYRLTYLLDNTCTDSLSALKVATSECRKLILNIAL